MDEIIQALKGFWPLLLLLAFFYFGMYRPQKKQQDKRNKFWEALKKETMLLRQEVFSVLSRKYLETLFLFK